MPEISIHCAPLAERLGVIRETRDVIRTTFKRVLGPIVPEDRTIEVRVVADLDEDRMDIFYHADFQMPKQTGRLIEDATLLCDLGICEWGISFIFRIPHFEMTAHEALEQVTEIAEIRRKGRPHTRLIPA